MASKVRFTQAQKEELRYIQSQVGNPTIPERCVIAGVGSHNRMLVLKALERKDVLRIIPTDYLGKYKVLVQLLGDYYIPEKKGFHSRGKRYFINKMAAAAQNRLRLLLEKWIEDEAEFEELMKDKGFALDIQVFATTAVAPVGKDRFTIGGELK